MMILFSLAVLVSGASAEESANACPNPGFELLNPAGNNFPLNWSAESNPTGDSGVVIDQDAHSGAIALRLFATADSAAKLNSDPLQVRRGTLRFFNKVLKCESDGTNLCVYAVALDAAGVEVTRTGVPVPAAETGDAAWRQLALDFDFSDNPSVVSVLIAARVNEHGAPGAADWLLDDFEVIESRLGAQPVIEGFYMPRPVMVTGEPAELVVQATNTGDEELPPSILRLVLPESVEIAEGSLSAEVALDALPPQDSRRMVWMITGLRETELDLAVEWAGVQRSRHGVCVDEARERGLCTRSDGFWRFMPEPVSLQENSGRPLEPLRTLMSRDLPDSHIGVTAHIPRSRDMESIFEARHLIDGDPETSWSGRGHEAECTGATDWAQVTFANPGQIVEIRMTPYWNATCFPQDFTVSLRSGGVWRTVHEARRVRLPAEAGQGEKTPHRIVFEKPEHADALRIEATRFGSPSSFFTDAAMSYFFRLSGIEAIDTVGKNVALAASGAEAEASWTYRTFYNSMEDIRATYPEMYKMGVKWNRIGQWGDLTCWHAVEPEKGVYEIDPETDRAITESVENGVNILFTLYAGNTLYEETPHLSDPGPLWKHGHPFLGDGGPTRPESIEGFVNYARFVARHFLGRVKHYEIWNEENSWAWYGSPPDPVAYGILLRETAKALKEIDPEIKVMVGGTAALAPELISRALDEGGGEYLDAIGFHPYTMPYPEMGLGALDIVDGKQAWKDKEDLGFTTYREMIAFYRATFSKYNPDFEFWANEWNCVPTREDLPYRGVSEIQEAKTAARFFLMSTLTGVRGVWWSLANRNTMADWGILRNDDLSRKPVYFTIQAMCTLLSGARPDPGVSVEVTGEAPELMCETLRGRDGETLVAVWRAVPPEDDAAAHRVTLRVSGMRAGGAEAVDTLHALTQQLDYTNESGAVVIGGVLAADWPVIVRLRPA